MPGADPARILVVEKNGVRRRALHEMLETRGFRVDSVDSGTTAIDTLHASPFELVILGGLPPGVDGFAVCRRIRAADPSRLNPSIPILLLTALPVKVVRQEGRRAGVDEILRMPFRAAGLFHCVDRLLAGADTGKSLRLAGQDGQSSEPAGGDPGADESERIVREVLESMSDRVRNEMVEWRAKLEALLAREAYDEIAFLAHKIRGTASVLMWEGLAERCRRLEEAAGHAPRAETAALVAEVNASLTHFLKMVPDME